MRRTLAFLVATIFGAAVAVAQAASPAIGLLLAGGNAPVWTHNFATSQALPPDISLTATDANSMVLTSAGTLDFPNHNLLVYASPPTLATQTTSALGTQKSYLLCLYGTGSVALSGAYSGSLAGAGAGTQAKLQFTPTSAAALTVTVTGSVTSASLSATTSSTCRAGDQVYQAAAYFGPKFDACVGSALTSGQCGFRRWEARTNLLTGSLSAFGATISTPSISLPDGTTGASNARITNTATTGQHIIWQSATSNGSAYSYSRFLKYGSSTYSALTMNTSSMAASVTAVTDLTSCSNVQANAYGSGASYSASSAVSVAGWCYVSISGVPASNGTSFSAATSNYPNSNAPTAQASFQYNGSGAAYTDTFGPQLEAAAFPGPYIPNGASQTTAAATTVSATGALATALAAGPWAYRWTNGQTGAVLCVTGAAGAFTFPVNGWMSGKLNVYKQGTPTGKVVC